MSDVQAGTAGNPQTRAQTATTSPEALSYGKRLALLILRYGRECVFSVINHVVRGLLAVGGNIAKHQHLLLVLPASLARFVIIVARHVLESSATQWVLRVLRHMVTLRITATANDVLEDEAARTSARLSTQLSLLLGALRLRADHSVVLARPTLPPPRAPPSPSRPGSTTPRVRPPPPLALARPPSAAACTSAATTTTRPPGEEVHLLCSLELKGAILTFLERQQRVHGGDYVLLSDSAGPLGSAISSSLQPPPGFSERGNGSGVATPRQLAPRGAGPKGEDAMSRVGSMAAWLHQPSAQPPPLAQQQAPAVHQQAGAQQQQHQHQQPQQQAPPAQQQLVLHPQLSASEQQAAAPQGCELEGVTLRAHRWPVPLLQLQGGQHEQTVASLPLGQTHPQCELHAAKPQQPAWRQGVPLLALDAEEAHSPLAPRLPLPHNQQLQPQQAAHSCGDVHGVTHVVAVAAPPPLSPSESHNAAAGSGATPGAAVDDAGTAGTQAVVDGAGHDRTAASPGVVLASPGPAPCGASAAASPCSSSGSSGSNSSPAAAAPITAAAHYSRGRTAGARRWTSGAAPRAVTSPAGAAAAGLSPAATARAPARQHTPHRAVAAAASLQMLALPVAAPHALSSASSPSALATGSATSSPSPCPGLAPNTHPHSPGAGPPRSPPRSPQTSAVSATAQASSYVSASSGAAAAACAPSTSPGTASTGGSGRPGGARREASGGLKGLLHLGALDVQEQWGSGGPGALGGGVSAPQ